MEQPLVTWPAIIKYAIEDELFYIADAAKWQHDADVYAVDYESADILIDSVGAIYHLNYRIDGRVTPKSIEKTMELPSALELVKAHFSSIGECCSAKLTARSIAQLLDLVGVDDVVR